MCKSELDYSELWYAPAGKVYCFDCYSTFVDEVLPLMPMLCHWCGDPVPKQDPITDMADWTGTPKPLECENCRITADKISNTTDSLRNVMRNLDED